MRFPKPLTIAMPAALVVLSVAGCGGGSDSTASTATTTEATPTLSKAELISQGDAICAEVNAAVGSVGTSEAAVPPAGDAGLRPLRRHGRQPQAAGDAGRTRRVRGIHRSRRRALDGGGRSQACRRTRRHRRPRRSRRPRPLPRSKNSRRQAGVYGFEDCSEGPSAPTSSGTGAAPGEEEGGVEVAPEVSEEPQVEEAAPEEVAPETGGAGGGVEEAAPEGGGTGGGTSGGGSGGVGPG